MAVLDRAKKATKTTKAEKAEKVDNKVPLTATARSRMVVPSIAVPRLVVPSLVALRAALLRAASSGRALSKDRRAGLVNKTGSWHRDRDREEVLVYEKRQ